MIPRLVVACVLLILLLLALPARPDPPAAETSTFDFVLDTPTKPILLRLHLEIDGQPLLEAHKAAQKEHLEALFRFLDRSGSGFLNEAQARGAPLPQVKLPDVGSEDVYIAYNFKALDADGDGKVSLTELASYYSDFEGGPFEVRVQTGPAGNERLNAALFALLDTDKDGRLSRQEIARAAEVLAKLDADDDERLTPAEIAPELAPRDPLVEGSSPVQTLPVSVPSPISNDPRRLREFAGRAPDLEVRIRLGAAKPRAGAVEVLRPAGKSDGSLRKGDSELSLSLPGTRIELRCDRSWLSPRSLDKLRRDYLREFHSADLDGDGFINRAEAQRRPFIRDLFDALDRNRDGRISERELLDHVDQVLLLQAKAMARQVTLLVSHRGQGIWDLLDRNRDGVLGLREIRAAPAVLASLDRNGDGFVDREEVPAGFLLQVGPGQTTFSRLSGEEVVTVGPAGQLIWSSGAQGGGPLWFRKMDRNGDGDVSRREFLGTPEEFKKLDLDGDGLISREEAEKAELLPGQKKKP
jgi:Ca2+-binding EF-hand superfamily protein